MAYKDPEAAKAYAREYYQKHRARFNALTRQWARDNPDRMRVFNREWIEKNPEKWKQTVQRYISKNRHKLRASDTLYRAIKRGEIERRPCEICGNPRSHGHHADYSKPLEVQWLCAVHHKKLHRSYI